jgi:hypothetical protein
MNQESHGLLSVLFDTGANNSFIKSSALPKGAIPFVLKQPYTSTTAAGELRMTRAVN